MEEEEIKGMLQKKQGKEKDFEQALEQNDELGSMNFHKLDTETLLQQFETDEKNGLTEAKAEEKLKRIGPNRLEEKKTRPWYVKLFLEMTGVFSLLLWAGAILSFIAYGIQKGQKDANVDDSNVACWLTVALPGDCDRGHRRSHWRVHILPEQQKRSHHGQI